jgi:hypothetical protein
MLETKHREEALPAGVPSSPVIAPPEAGARAERHLVRLLLAGEPWKSRVLELTDPSRFEDPSYRAIVEALIHDRMDSLDGTDAWVLERLRAEGLGEPNRDDLLVGALNWMEGRQLAREVDRLKREIPLASEEEKLKLVLEMRRLAAAKNAKAPWHKSTRGSGASGS